MSMSRHVRRGALLVGLVLLAAAPGARAQPSPDASPAAPSLDPARTAELISLLPQHLRDSCMAAGAVSEGAVASAQCLEAHGGLVLYLRYADTPSLQAAYDQVASLAGLAPDSGDDCGSGAFEGEYASPDGTVLGRVVCQVGADGTIAAWTEDELLVLGVVQVPQTDFGTLLAAWASARLGPAPDSSVVSTPSPGPSALANGPARGSAPPAAASPGSTGALGAATRQWAASATASSQYGSDTWSASQATGEPNTPDYGDHGTAWAPSVYDGGHEWLELTYESAVIPTEVAVWESSGNGFVTRVEAWDPDASTWVTLWQGEDRSPEFVVGFAPEIERVAFATDRLRISIDTAVPGWNEVDAVMLEGVLPDD
jgi:hypothetical protein